MEFLGWYHDDTHLYIAMEYFPLGDLEKYMTALDKPIDETDSKEISYQILVGINYMHQEGFAHRDVKPAVSCPSVRPHRLTCR